MVGILPLNSPTSYKIGWQGHLSFRYNVLHLLEQHLDFCDFFNSHKHISQCQDTVMVVIHIICKIECK